MMNRDVGYRKNFRQQMLRMIIVCQRAPVKHFCCLIPSFSNTSENTRPHAVKSAPTRLGQPPIPVPRVPLKHDLTRVAKPPVPERQTYEMIRQDLAAARRAWIAKAEDDPKEHRRRQRSDFLAYRNHAGLYADFHSIRHTFITNLCKADVSPKTAQMLARHSDIRLTMEVYTHVDQNEQIDAIRKLRAPDEGAA